MAKMVDSLAEWVDVRIPSKEWLDKERERRKPILEARRKRSEASRRLRQYGLTSEDFDKLLQSQENKCACCGGAFAGDQEIRVDHCHCTNLVRGLLCNSCNTAEGFLKTPENALK